MKDYSAWHELKTTINNTENQSVYFYEREIWWASIGQNVRFEEDGKDELFMRPVLVLRKFNENFFLGVPLSTTLKRGKYYAAFKYLEEQEIESVALLSQIRAFDAKRLKDKSGTISEADFTLIQQRLVEMISHKPQK